MAGTTQSMRPWKETLSSLLRLRSRAGRLTPCRARLALFSAGAGLLLAAIDGCTTQRTPIVSTSLTGNWVLQTTPNAGTTPFTSLAGFIDQETQTYAASNSITAALEAHPSTCYLGADLIPLTGALSGTSLGLYSFDVNGQYLKVSATSNSAGTALTGTYSVAGGCANGAAGTFSGTKYAVLKGTYAGSLTSDSARTLQLTLAQNVLGTGSGYFFVSGSATFGGFSCFTSGTMASTEGSIIGDAVQLDFTTNDAAGSHLLLTGTIDQTATTLTVASGTVTGGSCSGSLGQAILKLQ